MISKIEKEKIKSTKIVVFLGTWQEESQREFPKIMKVLDVVNYPKNKLEIIALNAKNESPKKISEINISDEISVVMGAADEACNP